MKKVFGIILTMIVFAGSVFANTITADTLKKDIQELILKDYSSKTTAQLDIKIVMLPFQSLTLPDGNITYSLVNTDKEINLVSREVRRVNILVDNQLQKTLCVPIEIKAYDDVLIAVEDIQRDQTINLSKVRTKKINIADKSNFIVTKDMLKKELIAKKDFRDGEFIDKRFVKIKPSVTKNSEVRIIINSDNGLQVAIDGIAASDGSIGEYITVENKTYNKKYTGKVIGENRVLVNI